MKYSFNKLIKILTVAAVVVLMLLNYTQNQEKKVLENYLAQELRNELYLVASAVAHNEQLLSRILTDGEVVNKFVDGGMHADKLAANFTRISSTLIKYEEMDTALNDEGPGLFKRTVSPVLNHQVMGEVLSKMIAEFTGWDQARIPLTSEQRERVASFHELNKRWFKVIEDSPLYVIDGNGSVNYRPEIQPEDYGLDSPIWPELLNGLEQAAADFLHEQGVERARDLWPTPTLP